MSKRRQIRHLPVPFRGRIAGEPTNVRAVFTVEQLDALAPLTKQDIFFLSKDPNPPSFVQEAMAARIQAAHTLKYRRLSSGT